MAHRDYIRLLGRWFKYSVVTQREMFELDNRMATSMDGIGGGVITPQTPICIGGEGVDLKGTASAIYITGGVSTERGGRLVLGNNDYPKFVTPRTRDVVMPICLGARAEGADTWLSSIDQSFDPSESATSPRATSWSSISSPSSSTTGQR